MRFVVAGGGFAGLAAALALGRAGHTVVVLERDDVPARDTPNGAFDVPRQGIPHFQQPHAFLPRGRRILRNLAPDVLEALLDAGAESQDLSLRLRGPRRPGDEDLVYLWVRRPVIEWALRRAVVAEPGVELRLGAEVTGFLPGGGGVSVAGGEALRGDVVVDALGRYRCPPGWPRAAGTPTDSGAIYYSRYFQLLGGAEHLEGPLLSPRGDLGYMGFNTFRGDDRTFAVILLAPAADRPLRALRHEEAWMAACAAMRPLDALTALDYSRPITGVLPMGGLMNVDRTGDPGAAGVVAVGDALCHTDPAFSWGLSLALAHGEALAQAAAGEPDAETLARRYRDAVGPEARERHALACAIDAARSERWDGAPLDIGRRDGCPPLFSHATAMATAPYDDEILRRAIGRIGLLDRTAVFDEDTDVHERIEAAFARMMATPPQPVGPPRDELLARIAPALRT